MSQLFSIALDDRFVADAIPITDDPTKFRILTTNRIEDARRFNLIADAIIFATEKNIGTIIDDGLSKDSHDPVITNGFRIVSISETDFDAMDIQARADLGLLDTRNQPENGSLCDAKDALKSAETNGFSGD